MAGGGKGGGAVLAVVLIALLGAAGANGDGDGRTEGDTSDTTSASVGREDAERIRDRLLRDAERVEYRFASDDDCAAHSYGRVREFFRERSCEALHRAYFEVHDGDSGMVLVATSWVEMPDNEGARDYRDLVDVYGTGNAIELSREQGDHRDVRFTARYYESRRDGVVVVNAQSEPVGRAADAAELERLATVALG